MSERAANELDVSHLPTYAFGHRSLMWWGTAGIMVIEGTVFALAMAAYFYIRTRVETWPPGAASPNLFWGSLNTLILLLSLAPNQWAKKAAEKENLLQVRMALLLALAFAAAFIVVRVFEFQTLNVRWDTNAYGSAVWMLMGLHTAHLVTDVLDTVVLAVLMFTGPLEGKRFVDVSENSLYWYFVVLTWLPIYAVIYLAPRFL
jgi:cytochrome c oxidase subunit III